MNPSLLPVSLATVHDAVVEVQLPPGAPVTVKPRRRCRQWMPARSI